MSVLMGRGGNPMREPLASAGAWSAVQLFGWDPRFAGRFRLDDAAQTGGGGSVAEVMWPIGSDAPIVRLLLDGSSAWEQVVLTGSRCPCGRDACVHQLLVDLAQERGLQNNGQLRALPYTTDEEHTIPGHQCRFRPTVAVPAECAPSEVILMGGRAGWSVIVRDDRGTSSFVATEAACSCGRRSCLHRLFV